MEKEKLPDGWKWSTLSKECDINPKRPKDLQADDGQETSFVPMEAVDGDLGTIKDIKTVSFSKVKKGYTYFEENDVLFAKITPCMQNKKSAIAKNLINEFGFGTTEFHVLRCKDGVIPEWIYYFIRNQKFVCEAEANFTGSVGHQRVPKTFLEDYPLIVPPLKIQREIVDKINKQMAQIEILKVECGKQINSISNMKSSTLNKFFNSKILKSVEMKPFGEITVNYDGKRVPLKSSDRTKLKKIYPYYGASGIIDYVDDYIYDKELLLIGEDGENLRSRVKPIAFLAKGKYWVNNHAHVVDAKPITSRKYLMNYINYLDLMPWVTGSAQPKLNQTKLNGIPIPLPDKDIQKQIVADIEEIDEYLIQLENDIQDQLHAINQFPESILNEVFGKYELPDEV